MHTGHPPITHPSPDPETTTPRTHRINQAISRHREPTRTTQTPTPIPVLLIPNISRPRALTNLTIQLFPLPIPRSHYLTHPPSSKYNAQPTMDPIKLRANKAIQHDAPTTELHRHKPSPRRLRDDLLPGTQLAPRPTHRGHLPPLLPHPRIIRLGTLRGLRPQPRRCPTRCHGVRPKETARTPSTLQRHPRLRR